MTHVLAVDICKVEEIGLIQVHPIHNYGNELLRLLLGFLSVVVLSTFLLTIYNSIIHKCLGCSRQKAEMVTFRTLQWSSLRLETTVALVF